MPSVRQAALEVLLALERGRTTLAAEVDRARRSLDDDRDRALLLELTNGTLRWQARLDALLAQCSKRPLAELDPVIRGALRLAAYQLEHLDRVPAHAALNESVELTRLLGQSRASGFVNAVLRTFLRTRSRLRLPAKPAGSASRKRKLDYLSTTLSHPEWLADRWLDRYGFDAACAWCEFNNRPPEVTVRPRNATERDKILSSLQAAGAGAKPAPFVSDAIQLSPGVLGHITPANRGELIIQEEASQIVAHVIGARPGDRVLDLCAAPGGKTAILSSALGGRGVLVASDYRPSRVRLLAAALTAARVPASIVRLDATRPLPFGAAFDRVLVDAPCSGLGTLRVNPDLKWTRQRDDLSSFASAQTAMIERAAEAIRPSGSLIYATCSSEPEENEQVVEAFLSAHPQYRIVPAVPGASVANGERLVDAKGFLHTRPDRDALDAFFAAVLVRDPRA